MIEGVWCGNIVTACSLQRPCKTKSPKCKTTVHFSTKCSVVKLSAFKDSSVAVSAFLFCKVSPIRLSEISGLD